MSAAGSLLKHGRLPDVAIEAPRTPPVCGAHPLRHRTLRGVWLRPTPSTERSRPRQTARQPSADRCCVPVATAPRCADAARRHSLPTTAACAAVPPARRRTHRSRAARAPAGRSAERRNRPNAVPPHQQRPVPWLRTPRQCPQDRAGKPEIVDLSAEEMPHILPICRRDEKADDLAGPGVCAFEKLVLKTGFPRGRATARSTDHSALPTRVENLPGNPVFSGAQRNPVSE